eukprot:10092234-Alexandrium_andersonii.AAC.1
MFWITHLEGSGPQRCADPWSSLKPLSRAVNAHALHPGLAMELHSCQSAPDTSRQICNSAA